MKLLVSCCLCLAMLSIHMTTSTVSFARDLGPVAALGTCKTKSDGNCKSPGATCTVGGKTGLCSNAATNGCDCDPI